MRVGHSQIQVEYQLPHTIKPTSRSPRYRTVRSICFVAVSCYAVVALIQLYILDKLDNPLFKHMFWYIVGMGGSYIFGAFLYGSRIPEKYYPGHFDYVVSLPISFFS